MIGHAAEGAYEGGPEPEYSVAPTDTTASTTDWPRTPISVALRRANTQPCLRPEVNPGCQTLTRRVLRDCGLVGGERVPGKSVGELNPSAQQCVELIGWGVEVQGLPRSGVQARCNCVEVGLGDVLHAHAFGEVLTQKLIRILVRAPLPWAARVGDSESAHELLRQVVEVGTNAYASTVQERAAATIIERNAQLSRREQQVDWQSAQRD